MGTVIIMNKPKKKEKWWDKTTVGQDADYDMGYNQAIDDYEAWLNQSANFKGDNIEQLQAKIDAIDTKLEEKEEALWKICEEKRKLERGMVKLREELFNNLTKQEG